MSVDSSLIERLRAQLLANYNSNSDPKQLVLDQTTIGTEYRAITERFSSVFGSKSIVLNNLFLQDGQPLLALNNSLKLRGTAVTPLLGVEQMVLEVTFEVVKGTLGCTIFCIDSRYVPADIASNDGPWLQANVVPGGNVSPLANQISTDLKFWRLMYLPARPIDVKLSDFLGIDTDIIGNLLNILPQDVKKLLSGLRLSDFSVQFDRETKKLSALYVGIEVGAADSDAALWTIVPDLLELSGLRAELSFRRFFASNGKTIDSMDGTISGTFRIGSNIKLEGTIALAQSRNWTLTVTASAGLAGLGLANFTQLLGGTDAKTLLPGSLGDVKNLNLASVSIEIDPAAKRIENLSLGLYSSEDWIIIKDRLVIRAPCMSLNIAQPFSPSTVTGYVTGTLSIGKEVDILVRVEKPDASLPWSMEVSTRAVILPSLGEMSDFLGGQQLASLIPESIAKGHFLLDNLDVSVNLSEAKINSIYFELLSNDTWVLIPPNSLSVRAVRIALKWEDQQNESDRNSTTNTSVVTSSTSSNDQKKKSGLKLKTGTIEGLITLAGVDIQVEATKNSSGADGWQFKGSTGQGQQIPIGTLIKDLVNIFGEIPLPSTIEKLTIQNLGIAFNTHSKDFTFTFESRFPIDEQQVELTVILDVKHLDANSNQPEGSFTKQFRGLITIGDFQFGLTFDDDTTSKTISGTYKVAGNPVGLKNLIGSVSRALGCSDLSGEIPTALDLRLQEITFKYDFTTGALVLSSAITTEKEKEKEKRQAVFLSLKLKEKKRIYVFGLDLPLTIKLADIPLVGDKLPEADQLGIDEISLWILSDTPKKSDVDQLKNAIQSATARMPAHWDMTARLSLQAFLHLGKETLPLSLSLGGETPPTAIDSSEGNQKHSESNTAVNSVTSPQASGGSNGSSLVPAGGSATPSSADSIRWFDVQKTFGIFSFKRIGMQYQNNELGFVLDASITVGGVTLALDGLGMTSPLTEFKPAFHLDGMGISYVQEPLEIQGAFLAMPKDRLGILDFRYDGAVIVTAADFTLAAVGSYGQAEWGPSMFIFAQLDKALGGPACFFVTGLRGGFGLNRKLRMPQQDEVYQFPFVRGLTDAGSGGGKGNKQLPGGTSGNAGADSGKSSTPLDVLKILDVWLTPQMGAYWLAVGIEFTSFKLVDVSALVVAEFGQELQLTLMGLAKMKLPQAPVPVTYAYLELQLMAVFRPAQAFIGMTAVLSPNSYVIDPGCKLTGGFAFYIWYDGEHAGDFVITLGGYHPTFKVPAHYPNVPRLAFNWPVNPRITMHGEAYFALTPSMVMGGGALEVSYRDGTLQAWFTAHADFLIWWKPFHYRATMAVSVGASYRMDLLFTTATVSIELAADMELWGPPMGGRVHVNWYIISFTVDFGVPQVNAPENVSWDEFKTLLPEEKDINKIVANRGVTEKTKDEIWIVRADEFQFSSESAIPATQLFLGDTSTPDNSADYRLDIRPMGKTDLNATHTLKVSRVEGSSTKALDLKGDRWTLKERQRNVPDALWGKKPDGGRPTPAATLLPDRLVGYQATHPEPKLGPSPGPFDMTNKYDPIEPGGQMPLSPDAKANQTHVPREDKQAVQIIIDTLAERQPTRDAVHKLLQTWQSGTLTNNKPTGLQSAASEIFRDTPLIVG